MRHYRDQAIGLMALAGMLILGAPSGFAESVCASVKLEINQDLTLEREGFDAHMKINNGVETMSISNVAVTVKFTDAGGQTVSATSDPNNTNALFYITTNSLSGISDVSGNGVVAPASVADIHWLIIPSVGAGGEYAAGTLYYVGATLSYKLGDAPYTTEVTPDYIYVKPMPNLALDYFWPHEVYGDDAFTEAVEPPVPFNVGLRVKNIGYGVAGNLKLDTAQPEIVANANGLAVGYVIRGCEVNGAARSGSLLVDFGNVNPQASSVARWEMTCSLSGIFTNFTAEVSHSDELGGRLTSLIQPENLKAHQLVHDVLVDLPGRDTVRDFLADDNQVYESEGTDSPVANLSSGAQLTPSGSAYALTLSSSATGFAYVKVTNAVATNMVLATVVRSDGKALNQANAWVSQQRKANPEDGWNYYLNVFDAAVSNYYYTINYTNASSANHAPVVVAMTSITVYAGENQGVIVQAYDEDGTTPSLTNGTMPVGARFIDCTNSTGIFSWTPSSNQVGSYWVQFVASDGELSGTNSLGITVLAQTASPWPSWWERRQVLLSGAGGTNDFAAANQGQVKHIASMAWQEMNALPGGAGFTLNFSNANNYAAVNLGQLKYMAKPFYDRLYSSYPWGGTAATNDYAVVNIGQVKNAFSLNPAKDSDADGMPDWWESHYGLNPNNPADASANPDNDAWINRDEYIRNTNPNAAD